VNAENPDRSDIRLALERQLAELCASLAATADNRKAVELDQTTVGRLSRMDAMQVQAVALAAERMRLDEIRRIEAAIRRIEANEYGYCVRCGEEVAPKRLAVDPTIAFCICCASASE
jgi:DnaK suppressor protein